MDINCIYEKAKEFTDTSLLNKVREMNGLIIYASPLLAAASATDELWEKLKDPAIIGAKHMSPTEWLPGAKSVIVYFLPFSPKVRQANRADGAPAPEWLYGRYEGEIFNVALRQFIAAEIEKAGGQAIVPILDQRFKVEAFRSNWSERHAAFIAGLGTFSLNKSIITECGAAGRVGTIITDMAFAPTGRKYTLYDEYCTKCGACIKRCPAECITLQGKDNTVCSQYLDQTLAMYKPRYGCGKCQTKVPCENRRPKK